MQREHIQGAGGHFLLLTNLAKILAKLQLLLFIMRGHSYTMKLAS